MQQRMVDAEGTYVFGTKPVWTDEEVHIEDSRVYKAINWYSYKYDRRHDISVVLSHEFSEEFDVGITWVYGTGNAITFPQATYWSHEEDLNSGPGGGGPPGFNNDNNEIEYYGERNGTRMDS